MESFFLSNKNYESGILIAYRTIEFFHLFIFLIALLKTNRPPFTDKKLYRFPPFFDFVSIGASVSDDSFDTISKGSKNRRGSAVQNDLA